MSLYQSLALLATQQGKTFTCGIVTPTGGSTTQASGLSVVDFCGVSFVGIQTLTHMFVSCVASGSDVVISNRKPTGAADVTPIAATTPWGAVQWWAFGDT